MRELEAIVLCPKCNVEKFRVYRVPTGATGVYRNVTEPENPVSQKHCECGAALERKR